MIGTVKARGFGIVDTLWANRRFVVGDFFMGHDPTARSRFPLGLRSVLAVFAEDIAGHLLSPLAAVRMNDAFAWRGLVIDPTFIHIADRALGAKVLADLASPGFADRTGDGFRLHGASVASTCSTLLHFLPRLVG